MLPINEEINKTANIMVEIKPQIKDEAGNWVENQSYKLELLDGKLRKLTPKNGTEPFEIATYNFNILSDNGEKKEGIYEIPVKSKKGDLNYQIKRMIELELDKEDIILLGTDEKGFISISKIGENEIKPEPAEDDIPIINGDEIDVKDIPF